MTTTATDVLHGDCLTVLPTLAPESVDAVVCDPPYGFSFMGKAWDSALPGVETWAAVSRVMRPGAYLVAFGGPRTWHRLACAIEDAGFEIHDTLCWLFGSGFPKHTSKLKPAHEPIILARKPAKYATPLNVDACRIGPATDTRRSKGAVGRNSFPHNDDAWTPTLAVGGQVGAGRWPANVVLDEAAARLLDAQSGERPSNNCGRGEGYTPAPGYGRIGAVRSPGYGDAGGASRYFLTVKPDIPVDFDGSFTHIQDTPYGECPCCGRARPADGSSTPSPTTCGAGSADSAPGCAGASGSEREVGRTPGATSAGETGGGTGSGASPEVGSSTSSSSTDGSGSSPTGRSLTGTRFTTETGTRSTTTSQICNCSPPPSTTITTSGSERITASLPASSSADASGVTSTSRPASSSGAEPAPTKAIASPASATPSLSGAPATASATSPTCAVTESALSGPRFLYCPKSSRAEREAGLDGLRATKAGVGHRAVDQGEYLDFIHPAPEGIGTWLREHRERAGLSAKDLCGLVGAHGAVNHGGAVTNWEREYNRPTPDQWRRLKDALGFDGRHDDVMTAVRNVPRQVFDDKPRAVARNHHPCVKPLALMRWLVRLVTPPNGTVLDPFCGSGSTGAAAVLEGFRFVGIEREAEYVEIARARIAYWGDPRNVRTAERDAPRRATRTTPVKRPTESDPDDLGPLFARIV